jgi:hypothetical protein
MTHVLAWGWGNPGRLKQSIFSVTSISSIADPRYTFGIENFLRESIREHLGRFVVDRRSLILFGVDEIGSGLIMFILRKILIPNNMGR